MNQALMLAKKGIGLTKPNPNVGAIIVKKGKVIGRGFHAKAGCEHAEIIALKEAGSEAVGADLFITLEPCHHFGRTPPCTEAIIKSGIKNIFVAIEDPNPLVSGKGIAYLKKNKLEVFTGILKAEAIEINRGFFYRMKFSRPYICSKIASSFDGKTSLHNGASKWITSDESRKDVQLLRSKACAILTGVGTINKDNPSLNIRDRKDSIQPIRIILDSHLSIHSSAKILRQSNVHLIYGDDPKNNLIKLQKTNIKIVKLKLVKNQINLNYLMDYLNKIEINNLLVEAGPSLNGSLLKSFLIDELVNYTAPILLGGNANPMFSLPVLSSMENKIKLSVLDVRSIGKDFRIISKVQKDAVD